MLQSEESWTKKKKAKKLAKVQFDSAYAILAASGNPFADFLTKKEEKFFKRSNRYEYIGWGTTRNVILCKELNVVYKFPNSLNGVIGNYIEAGLCKAGFEHISPCRIIDYKGIPVLEMNRVEDRSDEYDNFFHNGSSDDLGEAEIPEWLYEEDGYQVGLHDDRGLVYFDLGYSLSMANDHELIPGIKAMTDTFIKLVYPDQTLEKLYKDGDDWNEHWFPVKLLDMFKRIKKKG